MTTSLSDMMGSPSLFGRFRGGREAPASGEKLRSSRDLRYLTGEIKGIGPLIHLMVFSPQCDAGVRQNASFLRNISVHNFVIRWTVKALAERRLRRFLQPQKDPFTQRQKGAYGTVHTTAPYKPGRPPYQGRKTGAWTHERDQDPGEKR
jgi:hypothetical protein